MRVRDSARCQILLEEICIVYPSICTSIDQTLVTIILGSTSLANIASHNIRVKHKYWKVQGVPWFHSFYFPMPYTGNRSGDDAV